MKKLRALAAALLAVVLAASLSGCRQMAAGLEQYGFDRFMEKQFTGAMESSYLSARTYLTNPDDFGVDLSNVSYTLGPRFTAEEMANQRAELQEVSDDFSAFDRDLLTPEQQDLYDTFDYQITLQTALADEKFDYYAQLFGSMTGLHFQLPTLFSDWVVSGAADAEALIQIVSDVKPFIDSALAYTREQANRGLLMTDLDDVADYCAGILEQGENSAVLAAMTENIDALELGAAEKEDYKTRLTAAFTESFLPAYQAISDTMAELKESGKNNTGGLASLEHGKEYYALLLQQSVGSEKSVEEVRALMESAYQTHAEALGQLVETDPISVVKALTGALPETGYTSYEEILTSLQAQIAQDFPAVANLNYEIKEINEEIASDSGVAAYFNIPPIDGGSVQQLRVNPLGSDLASISTYSTVAHEGFPGHMYQYAYMYENVASNYVKAVADVPAYVEGFAVYAQYEALDYLEMDAELLDCYRENELLTYCAIILGDIGIHYDGWTLQEFTDYLNALGFKIDSESAKPQYDQLWANPCAFEPYYVGYEAFAALREQAEEALGTGFDEKSFHQALLESGTAPFAVVERNVQAYIERAAAPAQN